MVGTSPAPMSHVPDSVELPATAPAVPRRLRRRPAASVLCAAASGLAALHWIDAAYVNRWHGESAARGTPAALAAVLALAAAVLVWPRLPRGPRALTALIGGL